ncbi:MAG: alpha/beta fold hydrolase [Candidatus Dormibacteria bacterium]
MKSISVAGVPIDLTVSSGRLGAQRWGAEGAPLVLCVPGLSQDARSFEPLGLALGSDERQVVAISPRGRGRSEVTPEGTYGWPAHARDMLEAATLLGAASFDLMGWSFGAFVAMQLARQSPGVIRKLVLIDALGRPDPSSLGPIGAGLERLGMVFPTVEAYIDKVASGGAVSGCLDVWRDYLAGDLVPTEGGFTTRSSKVAVFEDALYGGTRDIYELWPALTMPVLLLRAAHEILPGLGHIVTEADRDRFTAEVEGARVAEVPGNHYCAGYAPGAVEAIRSFLDE